MFNLLLLFLNVNITVYQEKCNIGRLTIDNAQAQDLCLSNLANVWRPMHIHRKLILKTLLELSKKHQIFFFVCE